MEFSDYNHDMYYLDPDQKPAPASSFRSVSSSSSSSSRSVASATSSVETSASISSEPVAYSKVTKLDLVPEGDVTIVLTRKIGLRNGCNKDSFAGASEGMAMLSAETHIRTSSQHLCSASPVFSTMLANNQLVGDPLAGGHITLPLPLPHTHVDEGFRDDHDEDDCGSELDADAEVMHIVMSILHLRSKHIPRSVSLERLARIAIIVDRYQLHEAVEFVTTTWITALRASEPLPSNVCDDLVRWLLVASVFDLKDVLRVLEVTAVEAGRGPLDGAEFVELPVPKELIDSIERRRQYLIQQTLLALEAAIASFAPRPPQYSYQSRHSNQHDHRSEYHRTSDENGHSSKFYPSTSSTSPISNVEAVPPSTTPFAQWERHTQQFSGFGDEHQQAVPPLLHCQQHRELCDLAVLGSLIRSCIAHGLYPLPPSPYYGYSHNDIVEALSSFVLGVGGKCVASGFASCGATALANLLAECANVRTRCLGLDCTDPASSDTDFAGRLVRRGKVLGEV